MIVRPAELLSRDASVMPETAECGANPHGDTDAAYGSVSSRVAERSGSGLAAPFIRAHGEQESPPRAASVMPCLRPLRGKGPTAYVLEPGPLDTPCWVWQGSLNSKGYAIRGTQDGGLYLVHRRVFELAHRPLAEGEQAHHRCERRACVNPAHIDAHKPLEHAREHYGNATIAERAIALLLPGYPRHLREIAAALGERPSSVGVSLRRAARRGELVALSHQFFAVRAQEAAA